MHCAVIIPVEPENEQDAAAVERSVQCAVQFDPGPFDKISVMRVNCPRNDLGARVTAYRDAILEAQENAVEWLFFLNQGDIVQPFAFQAVFVSVEEQDAIFGLLGEGERADSEAAIRERQPQVRSMSRFEDLLCNDPDQTLQIGHLLRCKAALTLDVAQAMASGEHFVYFLKLWGRFRCCKLEQFLCVQRKQTAPLSPGAAGPGVNHQQLINQYVELLAGGENTIGRPDTEIVFQRALRFQQQGMAAWAERLFHLVLQYEPRAYHRAYALKNLKRHDEALEYLTPALVDNPCHILAWNLRGSLLQRSARHEEAWACFERGLVLDPDNPELFVNGGIALRKLKRYQHALLMCDSRLSQPPQIAAALYIQGLVFNDLGDQEKALKSFSRLLDFNCEPELAVMALHEKGMLLRRQGHYEEALKCFEWELAVQPNYCLLTHGELLYCRQLMCDWQNLPACGAELLSKIDAGNAASTGMPILALPSTRQQQRRCSELYLEHGAFTKRAPTKSLSAYHHDKIRLGYFSSDFHSHPVAYLTAELFELHDRSGFEVLGFSYGPVTQDDIRLRVERGFDRFIEVSQQSDPQIAELARAMEIDIAIDLSGQTQDSRPVLFAQRIAPLQVHYLGYAATLATDFIDYLIADPVVISEDHLNDYAEKIVFLPDSFMVSDRRRQIAPLQFTRSEMGLPETGLVFCAFNNPNKITPQVYDVWMNILREVDESVLWLSARNQWSVPNLRKEAEKRGICGERIVFTTYLAQSAQHLARHRLADLFLDTFYYGAHTTANDALWTGLPVLTYLGDTFASRVGASLLSAIGLPELIAKSIEEYQALAIALARNPVKLQAVKDKLAARRDSAPLFDTPRFTRHLEAAYREMQRRKEAGLAPDHIQVRTVE